MTKTLKKNIWRSITGSFGRYLAILLIIMLGVAFLTGLRLTRPAMIQTATDYLKQTSLYDLYLVSTIGFDEEDVTAAGDCDGVTAAERERQLRLPVDLWGGGPGCSRPPHPDQPAQPARPAGGPPAPGRQ